MINKCSESGRQCSFPDGACIEVAAGRKRGELCPAVWRADVKRRPVVPAGAVGGHLLSASLDRLWVVFCLGSSDTDVI